MSQNNENGDSLRKRGLDSNNAQPGEQVVIEPAEKKSKEEEQKVVESESELKCDDCNIVFPSGGNAIQHFKGKKHAKKVSANVAPGRWQNRETPNVPTQGGGVNVAGQHGNKPTIRNDNFANTTRGGNNRSFDSNHPNNFPNPPGDVNKRNNMQPNDPSHHFSSVHDNRFYGNPQPLMQGAPQHQSVDLTHSTERSRESFNSSAVELRNNNPSNNFPNPPRDVHINRSNNMHYNERRNDLGVERRDHFHENSSSSYGTSQYHSSDHRNQSQGYSSPSIGSQKDSALKSFYGSSLESYFNPPEKDFGGVPPDQLEPNQPRHDFDREKRDDIHRNSSFSNQESHQHKMNDYPTESTGYFNSSNAGPQKAKESLALKSFYGSSLDSYFNPPENDFFNNLPDNLEGNPPRDDFDDENHNFYGNPSPSNYETSQQQTPEPEGFFISSAEDFLRNPPDNLEAGEPGNDFKDTDDDFNENPAHSNYESPEQQQKDHSEEGMEDMKSSDAVENAYDINSRSPPKDYHKSSQAEQEDQFADSTASDNYYSHGYGKNNHSKSTDGYQNTSYSNHDTNVAYNTICSEIMQLKKKLIEM